MVIWICAITKSTKVPLLFKVDNGKRKDEQGCLSIKMKNGGLGM